MFIFRLLTNYIHTFYYDIHDTIISITREAWRTHWVYYVSPLCPKTRAHLCVLCVWYVDLSILDLIRSRTYTYMYNTDLFRKSSSRKAVYYSTILLTCRFLVCVHRLCVDVITIPTPEINVVLQLDWVLWVLVLQIVNYHLVYWTYVCIKIHWKESYYNLGISILLYFTI